MTYKNFGPVRLAELMSEIRGLIRENNALADDICGKMQEIINNCGRIFARTLETKGVVITEETEDAIIENVQEIADCKLVFPWGDAPGELIPSLRMEDLRAPLPLGPVKTVFDEPE